MAEEDNRRQVAITTGSVMRTRRLYPHLTAELSKLSSAALMDLQRLLRDQESDKNTDVNRAKRMPWL